MPHCGPPLSVRELLTLLSELWTQVCLTQALVPSTFHCFTDVLLESNIKTLIRVFCTTPSIVVNKLPAKTPLERGLKEGMLWRLALPLCPSSAAGVCEMPGGISGCLR